MRTRHEPVAPCSRHRSEPTAPLGYDDIGQNIFLRLMKATQTSLIIGFLAGRDHRCASASSWARCRATSAAASTTSSCASSTSSCRCPSSSSPDDRGVLRHQRYPGDHLRHRVRRLDDRRPPRRSGVPAPAGDGLRPGRGQALGAPTAPDHRAPHAAGCHGPARGRRSLGIADAVVAESALSFLGFGIAPPETSLGHMLQGYEEYFYGPPGRIFYPAVIDRPDRPVCQLPRRRPA